MVDRNSQKIAQFASRRQLQALEAAAAAGQVVILDALGRPLRVGDLVAVQALPQATLFRIVAADPVLADPRQVGVIHARLVCDVTIGVQAGHPTGMVLVEPAEAVAALDGVAPPTGGEDPAGETRSGIVLTDEGG